MTTTTAPSNGVDTQIRITPEEDRAALLELIAGERHQLAKLRCFIAFQRDVLNAPADHYADSEAAAMRCVQAIEWYGSWYGSQV